METEIDERKKVSKWKWCWECCSKQLFIKHDKCGNWFCTKHDIDEIDDEYGFPHWGYPICPICKEPMKQFKALIGCFHYEGLRTINNDLITYRKPYKLGDFYMIGIPKPQPIGTKVK